MINIIDRCNQLIELIEATMKVILINPIEDSKDIRNAILIELASIFPQIVEIYQQPEFEKQLSDISYWSNQLERIYQVNMQEDAFLIMDVFYYETRANLIVLVKILSQHIEEKKNES